MENIPGSKVSKRGIIEDITETIMNFVRPRTEMGILKCLLLLLLWALYSHNDGSKIMVKFVGINVNLSNYVN